MFQDFLEVGVEEVLSAKYGGSCTLPTLKFVNTKNKKKLYGSVPFQRNKSNSVCLLNTRMICGLPGSLPLADYT
jgi:hypothetical protein